MNGQYLIGIIFAAIIGLIALVVVSMPVDFAIGMLFGIGIYQIAHYNRHGSFLD